RLISIMTAEQRSSGTCPVSFLFTYGSNTMSTRRDFLAHSAQLGALATVGNFAFLGNLPPLSAQQVQRNLAPVQSDVEPLVRLIEDTARNRVLEEIATRI